MAVATLGSLFPPLSPQRSSSCWNFCFSTFFAHLSPIPNESKTRSQINHEDVHLGLELAAQCGRSATYDDGPRATVAL